MSTTNNINQTQNQNEMKQIDETMTAQRIEQISNKSKAQLSEKALAKLKRNADERERNTKYIKLDIGQSKRYLFDPEKIYDPEPSDFKNDDGTIDMVYPYGVIDPEYPDVEKSFTPRKQLSEKIDRLLIEGHRMLMIEKEKSGAKGRYNVYPVD
jgi:CHAT domain-containing protein